MKKVQVYFLLGVLALAIYLCFALSSLIPPVLAGVFLAYVFRPLKAKFHWSWLPHEMGVLLAFGFIVSASTLMFIKVKSYMPNEKEKIELKIRLDYKINEKFAEFFDGAENSFVKSLGKEMRPAVVSMGALFELTPAEQDNLEKFRVDGLSERQSISDKYYEYHQANFARRHQSLSRVPAATLEVDHHGELKAKEETSPASVASQEEPSTHLLHTLSLWMMCPLVFLFLIFDNGQIRRFIVGLVPNAYFEVTLTLMDRLDEALGSYLRGTSIECFLVGISTFIGLILFGLPVAAAVLLSILCGMINAIPAVGPAVGGLAIIFYSMICEGISPLVPLVTLENLPVAAVILVSFVHVLDNVLFAPIVLGKAVNLHPLVVILSLSAASMLFGIWGVVVTIPAVVVIKTIVHTLYTQLKAYRLL